MASLFDTPRSCWNVSALGRIRTVTFDVGGTLIEPWPSVGHVYAEVAAGHGVEGLSVDLLNQRFAAAWRQATDFNHGRDEWAALVDRTFAGITPKPPSQTFFPELYNRFAEPDAWRVFEDVLPALDTFAAMGINLGVISNWDDRLGPLLERIGLRKYFDAVVISCDVGFAKPSPVIFEHAAKKMGVAPDCVLHVGDSLEMDVTGARSAGFEAVHLAREGSGAGAVRSLGELPDWLGARCGGSRD
jgi:putative hydrolase of the HAD superfamily